MRTTTDIDGHVVQFEIDPEDEIYDEAAKLAREEFIEQTEQELSDIIERCSNPGLAYRRMMQYSRAVVAAQKVFLQKNDEYGDAIRSTGLLGCVVEFVGGTARLKAMVMRNPSHGRKSKMKSLLNALIDMLNYAVFGLFWLEEGNYDGKD